MREDALVLPLAPLYIGPYLFLEGQKKFFRLQLGDRTNVVCVNRLKPACSDEPISLVLPPLWFHPLLTPVLIPCLPLLSAVARVAGGKKAVSFHLPLEVPSCRNPHHATCERRLCSAVPSGGSTVADPQQPILGSGPVFFYKTTTAWWYQDSILCIFIDQLLDIYIHIPFKFTYHIKMLIKLQLSIDFLFISSYC